jgi:hypothetical protein
MVRDRDLLSVFYMWIARCIPTPFVEETISSPTLVFGAFVNNQMAKAVWAYVFIFVPEPCCFCYGACIE